MAALVLMLVAWGALAFGAVYDWAYWPLLAACALTACWGFVKQTPRARARVNVPLLAALLVVAGAISVQLIPLDRAVLVKLSPATDDFLRQYDVGYALRVVLGQRAAGAGDPASESTERGAAAGDVTPIVHPLSIRPERTVLGLTFLGTFGLLLLGLARGLDGRDLRVIAQGVTVLGVVMASIGIVQKALWTGKVYGFWEPENVGATAFGPFINRNHFAGWMLLALPVVIGSFASQVAKGMVNVAPGWRNRVGWFSTREASRAVLTALAILVMALSLVLTLSRSGILCFLIATTISGLAVLNRQGKTSRGRLLATYLVLVFVVSISWVGTGVITERFSDVDWGGAGRSGAWSDAWRIHRLFPVFGTGFNTYGTATVLLQQYRREAAHFIEAHNDYLQVLTEGGYLVAVPAAVLVLVLLWQAGNRFREHNDDRTGYWLRIGGVTGILAIAFQSVVDFSLQMPGNFALFTVLCAIAVRKSSATRADGSPTGAPDEADLIPTLAGRPAPGYRVRDEGTR